MDLTGINTINALYNPYAYYGINGLYGLNSVNGVGQTSAISSLLGVSASTTTSLSGLGKALSDISTLQTAAEKLTQPGVFSALAVTSSAPTVAKGTAATGTVQGSYSVQVNQLAQGQVLTSAAQPTKYAAIGSGADTTATFQFASGRSAQVTFYGGDNTVQGLADSINAAQIGITASVISSPAGYQLQLAGETGTGNAFTVSASGDSTLAQFLANPPGSGGLALSQQAQDAKGTINGSAFTSGTNTVATGVEGLSLKLTATGSATLSVAPNPDQTAAITDFVTAYNTLQQDLSGLARTYPGFGLTAPYLRSGLSTSLTPGSPGSGGIASLAEIGITGNANGTLSVNTDTLRAALASKSEAVASLFSTEAGKGVADQVLAQVSGQGSLSVTNLLQTAAPSLGSGLVNSLFAEQQSLLAQYTSLGSLTSSLLGTSNLLTSILNGSGTTTSSTTLSGISGLSNLNTLTALSSLLNQQPNQNLASLLFSL